MLRFFVVPELLDRLNLLDIPGLMKLTFKNFKVDKKTTLLGLATVNQKFNYQ